MRRFPRRPRLDDRLSANRHLQPGFTLIEVLVVVLIIGILAAVAIPVFWHQRQKANDATVKSDLSNYAKGAQAYLGDFGALSTTAVDQFSDQQGTPLSSSNNHYQAFISTTPGYQGFVIYGANDNGSTIFELNSFRSNAPTDLASSPANLSTLTATTAASDASAAAGTAITMSPTALVWP